MKYPTLRVVFDRKRVATKEKKGLVQVEILYNGARKWISTGVKVYSDQWKEKSMVCMRADAMELNDQINHLVNTIREWVNESYKKGIEFSFEAFEKSSKTPSSFLDFMEERISIRKISESTKRQHRVALRALIDFSLIQTFDDVTLKNIKLFDDYIKRKVESQVSVHSYHKRLKVYVNEALQLDLIKKNPYIGFSVSRGESKTRKYLEEAELKRIENVEIPDKSISNARDFFVFCCYTVVALMRNLLYVNELERGWAKLVTI